MKSLWISASIWFLASPVPLYAEYAAERRSRTAVDYMAEAIPALIMLTILYFGYRWVKENLAKIDEIRSDVKEIKRAVLQNQDSGQGKDD